MKTKEQIENLSYEYIDEVYSNYVLSSRHLISLSIMARKEARYVDSAEPVEFGKAFAAKYGLQRIETRSFNADEAEYAFGIKKRHEPIVVDDFSDVEDAPPAEPLDENVLKIIANAMHHYDKVKGV